MMVTTHLHFVRRTARGERLQARSRFLQVTVLIWFLGCFLAKSQGRQEAGRYTGKQPGSSRPPQGFTDNTERPPAI